MAVTRPDPLSEWVAAQVRAGAVANVSEHVCDFIERGRVRYSPVLHLTELRALIAGAEAESVSDRTIDGIFCKLWKQKSGPLCE